VRRVELGGKRLSHLLVDAQPIGALMPSLVQQLKQSRQSCQYLGNKTTHGSYVADDQP